VAKIDALGSGYGTGTAIFSLLRKIDADGEREGGRKKGNAG